MVKKDLWSDFVFVVFYKFLQIFDTFETMRPYLEYPPLIIMHYAINTFIISNITLTPESFFFIFILFLL